MSQLDRDWNRRYAANHADDALERLLAGVVIKAQAAVGDAAAWFDRGGLENQEARAAERELTQVCEMPGLGAAVDGCVLTHGCNDDPVGQLD